MKYKDIIIEGNKKFVKQTKQALRLIENKSKRDFNKINRYLKKIKQSKESWIDLEKAEFNVGNRTASHSPEWYASAIVHDTYHYYLNTVRKFLWIPKNFRKHEKLSLNEQIRFLRKIKMPEIWIKHCRKAIKSDYWIKEHVDW
jgi:hypothetical protein